VDDILKSITSQGGDAMKAAAALFETARLRQAAGFEELPPQSEWAGDRRPGLLRRCTLAVERLDVELGGKRWRAKRPKDMAAVFVLAEEYSGATRHGGGVHLQRDAGDEEVAEAAERAEKRRAKKRQARKARRARSSGSGSSSSDDSSSSASSKSSASSASSAARPKRRKQGGGSKHSRAGSKQQRHAPGGDDILKSITPRGGERRARREGAAPV
jgi:hypothetical protein